MYRDQFGEFVCGYIVGLTGQRWRILLLVSFPEVSVSGCFPKVRTGRLDCGRISHFENEKRFFHEFVMKNHLLHTYCLGFDRFCWMILIGIGNSMICSDI